jgi:hypothetical protein
MKPISDIFRSHATLDSSGRHIRGTDKQTNHRYGDAYESIFKDRDSVRLMMEVGTAEGDSLVAWSQVFPKSKVVGLDHHDIRGSLLSLEPDRFEFHCGNQRSKSDCERAAAGRQFDFICEDAGHTITDTVLTLIWLWPFVKPGGVYVVEEWDSISEHRIALEGLLNGVEIVDTDAPFGGTESLVVIRKPA